MRRKHPESEPRLTEAGPTGRGLARWTARRWIFPRENKHKRSEGAGDLEACAAAGAGLGGGSSADADADEHDVSVERLRCSERLLYLRNHGTKQCKCLQPRSPSEPLSPKGTRQKINTADVLIMVGRSF